MSPHDDTLAAILSAIATLPHEAQLEAVKTLIGSALHEIPTETIREIESEIRVQFADQLDVPIVGQVLDMCEGQLAIRAMRDEDSPL